MGNPNTFQESFAWYDDDDVVASSTAIGSPDDDLSPVEDTNYQLRVLLQNDGGKDEDDGYLLEHRVNTGGGFGAWADVTTTSSNVRSNGSSNFVDQRATATRIGSGTHTGGREDDDGGIASYVLPQAEESEHVFCIRFRSGDLGNGDIVEIRVAFDNGSSLDAYTVTPSSTISGFPEAALIQQYFRIRRTDDQGLNAAFDGGDPAENVNASIGTGIPFRIRFKVRETGSLEFITGGIKIQVDRNTGGYVDCNTAPDDVGGSEAPAGVVVLSSQFADGAATDTELLTSTTTDIDGQGKDFGITVVTQTLNNQETEHEFCLMINSFHDGPTQNVTDDTITFRLVQADGTVFSGTYTSPVITVVETPGYIGGTYPEHPDQIGPFVDGDDLYAFIEPSENDNFLACIKSTDDGATWREMDGANRPTSQDVEGLSVRQDGSDLHILHSGPDVWYHRFFTSSDGSNPDKWGSVVDAALKDQVVSDTHTAAAGQHCSIVWRSDGTAIGFYVDDATELRVRYRIRGVGDTGTWDSELTLDAEASTAFGSAYAILGESDTTFVIYKEHTNGIIYVNTITSGDTLESRQTIKTGIGTANAMMAPYVPPIYYDDAGTEVIAMVYQTDNSTPGLSNVLREESLGVEKTATDNNIEQAEGTNQQMIASMDVHNKELFLFYSEKAVKDIWRTSSDDEAAWDTDTEEHDAVAADWIRGKVIVEPVSGDTVFGYLWDNESNGHTGFIFYDTFLIEAAAVGGAVVDVIGGGIIPFAR